MMQNVNNILRLIETGKIDANKAIELIEGMVPICPLIIL
jgi:hypothetical protein